MVMTCEMSSPSSRREHAIEFELQQVARLAVQNLEHFPPQRLFPGHTLRPRLPFAVPGTDAVSAIDGVQADRQRVDDARGEVVLGFELPRAQGDLGCEVLR